MNRLLDYLRRVLEEPLGDADLLDRFIDNRDETAFAALLKRHGPMVLGVCQRILGNPHDAEDAFQATFLILARRASSVRPREAVGNWLYGVAYRTALEARAKLKRRFAREKQVDEMPEPEERQPSDCHDLLALLDRELHRLPDKYRLPVVLCDLEGRGRKEVARQLAIPEGTLSSRLAAARKKLAWRLTRYGLSVSGASLAMLMTQKAASACVPASLLVATLRAAMLLTAGQAAGVSAGVITLTEGVLRTMFIAKLKTATVCMCGVAALGLGTGGLMYQTRVGAADSPRPGQSRVLDQQVTNEAGVIRDDEETRQNERAKRAAEEEQLRARELLEKARKEAEMQRERAQADSRRAEEALRELKEQLAKAQEAERRAQRQAAERRAEGQEIERRARQQAEAQEAEARAQAQEAERRARQQEEKIGRVRPDEPQRLNQLSEAEARVREEFERHRQSLKEQMRKLEVEERQVLQKLEIERSRLSKQKPEDRESPAGDKLDRILERLERMERRLDRLERGDSSPGGRRY